MFSERVVCQRVKKVREGEDYYEDVDTGKIYAKQRLFLQTPAGCFFLHHNTNGLSVDAMLHESSQNYSFTTDFVSQAALATSKVATNVAPPVLRNPFASKDLDRVLNVCQDMGQWPWAYCVMLDVLGLKAMSPRNVVWDGPAHTSALGVLANGRVIWLAGVARQVIEYWFAAHGGYHCKHDLFVADRSEYDRACDSVASPWSVAGVTRVFDGLNMEWALANVSNELEPLPTDYVSADSVLYRTDADKRIQPMGYAKRDTGTRPPKLAWDSKARLGLLSKMNVPLHLRTEVLRGKEE